MAEIEKSNARAMHIALRKLRSFLDASEPRLVYFLTNLWHAQGRAITYKEIREAILAGVLDAAYLEQWHEDYARFVVQYLQPAWEEAMKAAAAEIAAKHPEWTYKPAAEGVEHWMRTRAADFVTNVSQTQIDGLRALITKASTLHDMSVDELSRAIRPMVGLTMQQSNAAINYFTKLKENGVKPERAKDLTIRYSARMHRYRGYNIARTELAFGYNKGMLEATKQAQEEGYLGKMVKVWCTADDERVCHICGGLEGKTIAMDEDFDFNTKLEAANPGIKQTPPAHPSCRCTVLYQEVEPPTIMSPAKRH